METEQKVKVRVCKEDVGYFNTGRLVSAVVEARKDDDLDAILQAYLKYDVGEMISEEEYDEIAQDLCDDYSAELSFCAMEDSYEWFDEVGGYLNIDEMVVKPCHPDTPLGVTVINEKRKNTNVRIERDYPKKGKNKAKNRR